MTDDKKTIKGSINNNSKIRPTRSRNIFTDIKYFLINKAPTPTLVHFDNEIEKQSYYESVLQRVGVDVDDFKVFNIHKIGVNAPASYLFEEVLKWDGDSACWPNHIAKVNLLDNTLEKIQINLFGFDNLSQDTKKRKIGSRLFHLFDLNSIKIQKTPTQHDSDNARYLLYECNGGYPIGVFCMYVRSSIEALGEKEASQLFIMVGFDFFGKQWLSKVKFINKLWEFFHNRVTSAVAWRFKQLCEWRLEKLIENYPSLK